MTEEEKKIEAPSTEPENAASPFIGLKKNEDPVPSEEVKLRDLLEKNLKWSQIIYEQNRRISRRLLWSSIFSWFKWIIFIGALVWGTWYVWPMARNLMAQYEALTSGVSSGQKLDQPTLDKILKMIPLTDTEKEQIKAMNK
ncbi:MAG: hypothetical protein NTW66_04300 [Candidatus Magasanikbacteria bacterium]|nr:hypothetical protein [Candidatus Magasanikbacteria bacterium]